MGNRFPAAYRDVNGPEGDSRILRLKIIEFRGPVPTRESATPAKGG